jgi:hypothetical protein
LGTEEQLSIDIVIRKLNGLKRQAVPIGCDHLTMFVDVQGRLLY